MEIKVDPIIIQENNNDQKEGQHYFQKMNCFEKMNKEKKKFIKSILNLIMSFFIKYIIFMFTFIQSY